MNTSNTNTQNKTPRYFQQEDIEEIKLIDVRQTRRSIWIEQAITTKNGNRYIRNCGPFYCFVINQGTNELRIGPTPWQVNIGNSCKDLYDRYVTESNQ